MTRPDPNDCLSGLSDCMAGLVGTALLLFTGEDMTPTERIRAALQAHGLYHRALASEWKEVRDWGELLLVRAIAHCTMADIRQFLIDEVAREETP